MVDGTDAVAMSVTHHTPGRHGRTADVTIPVITIDSDAFPPHPPYESCPPISRSVLTSPDLEHTLTFLPYADDDRFPAEAYQTKFDSFEWEMLLDPDGEFYLFSVGFIKAS